MTASKAAISEGEAAKGATTEKDEANKYGEGDSGSAVRTLEFDYCLAN